MQEFDVNFAEIYLSAQSFRLLKCSIYFAKSYDFDKVFLIIPKHLTPSS